MNPILKCRAPPQNRATQGSFFGLLDPCNHEAFGKRLAIAGNAFPIRLYHHGIPQDSLDPSLRLTHFDIRPCFISSALGKRDPVQRLHREAVLSRNRQRAQGTEGYHISQ